MAFYIYTDSAGKEIRREPKGRGRVKANSIQKEDGNFYITEVTANPTLTENKETLTPNQLKTEQTSQIKDDEELELAEHNQKGNANNPNPTYKVKNNIPLTLNQFFHLMFWTGKRDLGSKVNDYSENDEEITIIKPVASGYDFPPNFNGLGPNGTYAKISIDKKTGDIKVWSTYQTGDPTRILLNSINLPITEGWKPKKQNS